MRRGYTREAYLSLAHRIRETIPGVALSSDFISGFCGETEADHAETLSLFREVRFETAYMFAYSRRERTHAAYHLDDDVPDDVKNRRLREVIDAFREGARTRHAEDIGTLQLVLIDGPARKSTPGAPLWAGRTDSSKRCIVGEYAVEQSIATLLARGNLGPGATVGESAVPLRPGQYVAAYVRGSGDTSLQATALAASTLDEFATLGPVLRKSLQAESFEL